MIDARTIEDLELEKVKAAILPYCRSEKGRNLCSRIRPYRNLAALSTELRQTDEYIRHAGGAFPSAEFSTADNDIKLLSLEGSSLPIDALIRIYEIASRSNAIIAHILRYEDFFTHLKKKINDIKPCPEICRSIDEVIDSDGTVKDSASATLQGIRRTISSIRGSIDSVFRSDMARYRSEGFLDEIGETVIDHRRVLAVSAMYRRRVPGMFMGTSKTGSIVYIEPESTSRLSGALADALAEEKKEIYRILTELCTTIRPHTLFLAKSQKLLTEIDLLQAKARYAEEIGACLPKISRTLKMNLIEAYHPILLLTNRQQGRETFPQNIVLTPSRRIIAISGPNAGGKSITLKTVGLLQLMLQCGLPVPVNPESTMCLFNTIITDIGDNQSIENHLSTYSYRLKKMADFLSVCDEKTLFLIDEFGTGSDPDLGGALAEVFLEEFYRRGAYGVLTTHYTNIKLLAEKLPEAVNASMLFDEKTLMPLYRLFVGQAGSSFTFEVARMNGISQSLIDRARSRVEHDKIVLERTIASLQKEKSSIVEKSRSLSSAQKKAESHATALEKQSEKISSKLESYQVLYDRNVKEVQIGRKVSSLAESYFYKKTSKKDLTAALIKIVEMENARRGEKLAAAIKEKERQKAIEDEKQRECLIARERKRMAEEARREEQERERIEAQMQKEIEPIRAQKAIEEAEEAAAASRPALNMPLGVGDRVRLSGGYAVGVIDRIEKGRATVDYGWFTTQVAVEELDLVERVKRDKK